MNHWQHLQKEDMACSEAKLCTQANLSYCTFTICYFMIRKKCLSENMICKARPQKACLPCTICITMPFTNLPQGGRFCNWNFFHCLDLCHVNQAYHRIITFLLLYRLWTNQKNYETGFEKFATFEVKCILLRLVHLGCEVPHIATSSHQYTMQPT